MKSVAVSGGIGSGKSTVCRILSALCFEVYDCDQRAKHLMDNNKDLLRQLAVEFGEEVIDGAGGIDRKKLAGVVFGDRTKLERLNAIVHKEVRNDLSKWLNKKRESGVKIAFVETAILYQSGLDKMVDEVWEVEAPERLRVERVMKRSNLSVSEVESRINAQKAFIIESPHANVKRIINDGVLPLLPQIETLLKSH